MDESLWASIGGGLGIAIGLVGGVIGVRASLKNAKSDQERRLVWRFSLAILGLVGILMAGLLLLPPPYNWLSWIPYAIVLVVSIRYANKLQAGLRNPTESSKM
ncbi:MAG: hypothetical protein KF873_02490 [Gemmataceae bacterium]|nr:hypothetical protein [Gemmataceae bacterium]